MLEALSYAKRVEEKEHSSPIDIIDQIVLTVNQSGKYKEDDYWNENRGLAGAPPVPFMIDLNLYLSAKVAQGKLDLSGSVGLSVMKAVLSPYGTPALADMSSPLLKLFLSNGVDPNLETYSVAEGLSAWQTFLMRPAISSPRQSEQISHWLALATLFLDYGADPQCRITDRYTDRCDHRCVAEDPRGAEHLPAPSHSRLRWAVRGPWLPYSCQESSPVRSKCQRR